MSEELLVTNTEGTTGRVREMEGEEARDGDEERVIAVEEKIVLNEGEGMEGMSRGRRMGGGKVVLAVVCGVLVEMR